MADDFESVCSKIEDEKQFLQNVSQEIWRNPELKFQEHRAHDLLTIALCKHRFRVAKHYILDTAFRAEFSSTIPGGPVVAILLEYDALPTIGHACGHNLIAEAGLAAAIAIKDVMEKDNNFPASTLVVMGTPAEESGGGKIKLLDKGAFEGVDAAMMVHPTSESCITPPFLCIVRGNVEFSGKESHAAAFPWEGINALDAAVACYNSLSLLRQQIKPADRIHVIITEGGVATNVIPGRAKMQISIRTPTVGGLDSLRTRVEDCIKGAATSTGCTVNYFFDESEAYQNVLGNKVLGNVYQEYFEKGQPLDKNFQANAGSTDMGNVSHVVPAIHPFFAIPTKGVNHTKEFTEAAGSIAAQEPTLAAAKAMAMTALAVMRNPDVMKQVKDQFAADILEDLKIK